MNWIWENDNWPGFTWNEAAIEEKLQAYERQKTFADVRLSSLLEEARVSLHAEALAEDAVSSSALEGMALSKDALLSEISRLEGLSDNRRKCDLNTVDIARLMLESDKVSVMDIDEEMLLHWHTLLFSGASGKAKPEHIGTFRNGPVYVMKFSGSMESEVMYEAVPHERISNELSSLFDFIRNDSVPHIIRSAVAAAWMPLIHPFEDGNGRISRLLSDAVLFENDTLRSVSISSAIRRKSKEYHAHLEELDSKLDMDLTSWICWYIDMVIEALGEAEDVCMKKIRLSAFMATLDPSVYNSREISILYRLASGSFQGNLTPEKWMKLTRCKSATATRDLSHLVEQGLLERSEEGGRTTSYHLRDDII